MNSKYQNQINNAIRVDLETLYSYNEVCKIFKQNDIREYVYCFVYKDIIVKYGYSTSGRLFGERAYRQIGHLNGWRSKLSGSSGSDMRIISDKFAKKYGYPLNRNGMVLYIIDMNRKFIKDCDPYKPTYLYCEELERELIDDCVSFHGKAPVGNCDSVTKYTVKMFKQNKHLETLFSQVP